MRANASHHSYTLKQLVRTGLVAQRPRYGLTYELKGRARSYVYRVIPAVVRLEVRAAAIAAGAKMTTDEQNGFDAWPEDPVRGDHRPMIGWIAARWAGWLAREIANG